MEPDPFTTQLVAAHIAIARVITQATLVEGIINAYIAEYYTRCPDGGYQNSYLAFMFDILDNRFVSLNTKIDILFKVLSRVDPARVAKGSRKQFEDWVRCRNICAHGRMIGDTILHEGRHHNPQAIADQALAMQGNIMNLLDAYPELRGPYFNLTPTKDWPSVG